MRLVIECTVAILMGVMVGLIMAGWVAGCGESYVDANGDAH